MVPRGVAAHDPHMRTTHPGRTPTTAIDPYGLDEITWTRAELLRIREADSRALAKPYDTATPREACRTGRKRRARSSSAAH